MISFDLHRICNLPDARTPPLGIEPLWQWVRGLGSLSEWELECARAARLHDLRQACNRSYQFRGWIPGEWVTELIGLPLMSRNELRQDKGSKE